MAVGGTGLVGGEGEVRWKESHRQEWTGLDWKSHSGLGDRRVEITLLMSLSQSPKLELYDLQKISDIQYEKLPRENFCRAPSAMKSLVVMWLGL